MEAQEDFSACYTRLVERYCLPHGTDARLLQSIFLRLEHDIAPPGAEAAQPA